MATQLTKFIERYLSKPFEWGSDDCSLFIADWWMDQHGEDPAAMLRGTYCTEHGAHRAVARAGGLDALVGAIASSVGAKRAQEPSDGVFGTVIIAGAVRSAIYVSGAWAIRAPDGVVFSHKAEPVRLWSV